MNSIKWKEIIQNIEQLLLEGSIEGNFIPIQDELELLGVTLDIVS